MIKQAVERGGYFPAADVVSRHRPSHPQRTIRLERAPEHPPQPTNEKRPTTPPMPRRGITASFHAISGPVIDVNLSALSSNYHFLRTMLGRTELAAVIKADAYGLGMVHIAETLYRQGCRIFMVAQPEEGACLRRAMGKRRTAIYVLNGLSLCSPADFAAYDLIPVISNRRDAEIWAGHDRRIRPAAIQLETGLNRLGFKPGDALRLMEDADIRNGLDVRFWMSHLACAEVPGSDFNLMQLQNFRQALASLPDAAASLANSAGTFLGRDYHFDLVRTGSALYGVNPRPGQANPMREVVRMHAPILQVNDTPAGAGIGYGLTVRLERPSRIAVIAAGYADGYMRSLSNRAEVAIGRHRAPVVGRVSMDVIMADVTDIPDRLLRPGKMADLIGGNVPLEEVADWADTAPFEILTGIGKRSRIIYTGEG